MSQSQPSSQHLTPRNPLHWLQLFYWLLLKPAMLGYYGTGIPQSIKRGIGAWLLATVMCLPLLLWILPLLFKPELRAIFVDRYPLSPALLLASIVLLWLGTGVLGGHENPRVNLVVGILIVAESILIHDLILFYLSRDALMILAGLLAFSIAFSIAGEIGYYSAPIILVGTIAGIVIHVIRIGLQVEVILAGASVTITLVTVAKVSGDIVVRGIRNQQANTASYVLAVLLLVSYLVLFWRSISLIVI